MRILFDGYWWLDGPPSGRNVLRSVVNAWADAHPRDELTVRVPASARVAAANELTDRGVRVDAYKRWLPFQALAAGTLRAKSREHDAVVTQNFSSLAGSSLRTVFLHDVMFVEHPEWFTMQERRYLGLIRPSLRRADLIFTTSASETERVRRTYPEISNRCVPVGLGIPSDIVGATPRPPALPIADAPPFVLAVGRLNVRKNLARLIAGFGCADRLQEHHLIIVGEPDGAREDLRASPQVARRVHFLGFVDTAELRWLYKHAALFAFPSLDEGFGLPILEAAVNGAAVAASDIPPFRELGLVDVFFDPEDVESIAAALATGVGLKPERSEVLEHTWDRTVHSMRCAIGALLLERSGCDS